ncbi:MAG: hypothetical protein KDD39_04300 [Bdellovibrionales bacterium]|nr:hypothetical protein [Bdellovibrionales bacterium]
MFRTLIALCVLGVPFCLARASARDGQRDIYSNSNLTRRPAEGEEFNFVLSLGGCSGFILAPNVGGSAAHCRKSGSIKSGVALREGRPSDGTIGNTLEIGNVSQYDYWIFEIRWNGGQLPEGAELVPRIQTAEKDLEIGEHWQADSIYTLGFPADISNGELIHSWGYPKTSGSDGRIVNNIALINGNSGGGIWRESDNMLVSIVSGGPHAFQQPGWNNNNWMDPDHWNHGPAMWKVYANSQKLKDIFPDGKNRYLGAERDYEDLSFALPHVALSAWGY